MRLSKATNDHPTITRENSTLACASRSAQLRFVRADVFFSVVAVALCRGKRGSLCAALHVMCMDAIECADFLPFSDYHPDYSSSVIVNIKCAALSRFLESYARLSASSSAATFLYNNSGCCYCCLMLLDTCCCCLPKSRTRPICVKLDTLLWPI